MSGIREHVRGASFPFPPVSLLESFDIFEILTTPKTHLFLTVQRFYQIVITIRLVFCTENVHLTE